MGEHRDACHVNRAIITGELSDRSFKTVVTVDSASPSPDLRIAWILSRPENNGNRDVQGQAVPFSLPEPWPDPADGATLLHDLKSFIGRYVILPAGGLDAVAHWVICTWLVEVFATSAYLVVQSQTRECGKTRLLEVLDLLVRKPFFSVAASEAALFRILDSQEPTLIIDEAEALAGRSERSDAVRTIINAAHRRGLGVPRCIGDDKEVRMFKVFAFIAIAGIGRTWDTIEGRSITIQMERKSPSDSVSRFRRKKAEIEAENLRRRIMRWSGDNAEAVAEAQPALPEFLGDREQDVWEPLMCVAHTLGPAFAENLTESAKALLRADDEDNAPQVQIIRDLKIIFGDHEKLFSETICEELAKMEGHRWPEYRNGKPITQNQLARLLKGFKRPDGLPIGPTDVRLETVKKGYHRNWFERLFAIYAKNPPSKALQALQASNHAASSGYQSATPNRACSASKTPSNPRQDWVVAPVALQGGFLSPKEKNERTGRTFNVSHAAELLTELQASGVRVRLQGERITTESDFQLPPELTERIRQNKTELVGLLQAGEGDWVRESEWTFKRIEIPNQTHTGQVDVWLCGWNQNRSIVRWSFVETKKEGWK
jgi:hypothetical protein